MRSRFPGADTVITTNPTTGAVTVVPTVVGRKIENTPERTFSFASEYRFASRAAGTQRERRGLLHQRARREPVQPGVHPGYTLFDLGAAYTDSSTATRSTIRVTGQNIADKKYFSSTGDNVVAQGPPRLVKLSMTMRF